MTEGEILAFSVPTNQNAKLPTRLLWRPSPSHQPLAETEQGHKHCTYTHQQIDCDFPIGLVISPGVGKNDYIYQLLSDADAKTHLCFHIAHLELLGYAYTLPYTRQHMVLSIQWDPDAHFWEKHSIRLSASLLTVIYYQHGDNNSMFWYCTEHYIYHVPQCALFWCYLNWLVISRSVTSMILCTHYT